jgi:hypothetical protein
MNLAFDVALGREVEFWNRVNDSDPTNAVFVILVLANAGLESDATLRTYSTVSDLLAGASNEVTNTGYARITLTDASIGAYTVDTTNHTITLPLSDQTWATPAAGDLWRKGVIAYDSDSTAGTDANLIPVAMWDVLNSQGNAVTPNGSAITMSFPNGLLTAS